MQCFYSFVNCTSVFKTYLVTSFIGLDFTCTGSFGNLKYKNSPTCLFWLQVVVAPTCPVCLTEHNTTYHRYPHIFFFSRPYFRITFTNQINFFFFSTSHCTLQMDCFLSSFSLIFLSCIKNALSRVSKKKRFNRSLISIQYRH